MDDSLRPIEHKVLSMMLAGDDVSTKALRNQIPFVKVSQRTRTGVGFYSVFVIPNHVDPINDTNHLRLNDVYVQGLGLDDGGGFRLSIKNGKLDHLEGFSYGDSWPDDDDNLELLHVVKKAVGRTGGS